MLDHEGFDLWADSYDRSTACSDESGSYPFAGYSAVLQDIFRRVLSHGAGDVLDIGFGTGVLTASLYQQGCHIWGQDFSEKMVALAQAKMPSAALYCGDFAAGLAEPLTRRQYDAIIATYSLHHLTDQHKIAFIRSLMPLLRKDACLYIGDVAFRTRADLDRCRLAAGDTWDADEIYFVFDELRQSFPQMTFLPLSPCAGVLSLQR